eukprot:TRINITY_DN8234_c0_g1_i1.p1 TRINITY_DN8234_c0_g1~~TRINITY_DN8234_c0_g1_i1.p1  ORF type:complete len:237 (-),score=72.47 TRINITY_DN8234_c0_g1_i1:171-881(-)
MADEKMDAFLRDFEEQKKLADSIYADINARNNLLSRGGDATAMNTSIRRKLSQLSAKITQLDGDLDRMSKNPSKYRVTEKEIRRRGDLLDNLQNRREQLNSMMTSVPQNLQAQKTALFGGATGGSVWGGGESEETKGRDNQGLLDLQESKFKTQDEKLDRLGHVVREQKDVAGKMGGHLTEHNKLLDDFEGKTEVTTARVELENSRVGSLQEKAATGGFWMIIIVLFVLIIVLAII